MVKITEAQRAWMLQALGTPAGSRNNIKDWADRPTFPRLVTMGYMKQRNTFPDGTAYYSVTRKGAKAIGLDPAIIRTKEATRKRVRKATTVETPQDG